MAARGRRSASIGAVLLSAVVLSAALARAQDSAPPAASTAASRPWGPRLSYRSAPGCLDEETFRHAVAGFFEGGADPFDADAPDVLHVTIDEIPGGYRGTIQYTPAKGDPWPEQVTTGATCSQVFRSAARIASMRVPDPPQAPPAPAPVPASPPSSSPPPQAGPVASQTPRAPPPPSPPPLSPEPLLPPMDLTIALHTAFVLTAGFTDNVGPAVQIGASARHDWDNWGISLGLELRGVFPAQVVARETANTKPGQEPLAPEAYDMSQLAAQLVPCVHFAKYFAGCGVVQGFMTLSQTYDELIPGPGWGLGPRFQIEVPFTEQFGGLAFAEALFPLIGTIQPFGDPADLGPNGREIIWRQSIVSGFFGAGVYVAFR